jgi:putative ABC transport system permease protein
MLTAAFGAFALVVVTSIERGQVEASWRAVGADYRVEAAEGASLEQLDPATIAGVDRVARSFVAPSATLQLGVSRVRIYLEAIDAAGHEAVTAASPLAPRWPAEFIAAGAAAGTTPTGTVDQPIPAIVSSVLPGGLPPIAAGSDVRIQLAGRVLMLHVLEVRASMPGIVPGETFIVAPLAPFLADPALDLKTNVLYARGGPEVEAELATLAEREAVGSAFESRHAWYRDLQARPLIGVVGAGFRLGLVIALAYAALAIVTTLTLTAARRARDVAFLRPLGLSARQAAGVTIVEHGVPVILAIVPGIATGIAVALLLESSLGLEAFIGVGTPYRVQLDWPGIVGIGALLGLVVAGAIVVSTWLSQRMRVVDALRAGEA